MFLCCSWKQTLPEASAVYPLAPQAQEPWVPASNQRLVSCGCSPPGFLRAAHPGPSRRLGGTSGVAMVLLHVKRGDESQFLMQAPGNTELEELTVQVTRVYNARLKVQRVCSGGPGGAARLRAGSVEPGPGRDGLPGLTGPGREKKRGQIGTEEVVRDPQGFLGQAGGESQVCKDLQRRAAAGLEM